MRRRRARPPARAGLAARSLKFAANAGFNYKIYLPPLTYNRGFSKAAAGGMSDHGRERSGRHEPGELAAMPEARRHRRKAALWSAFLDTGAATFACVLLNLSEAGAMVQLAAPVAPDQKVMLVMERYGTLRGEVVWRLADKGKVGIRFTEPPDLVARFFGEMPA